MKRGIIFDLDGTLWDSTEQVVESWNQVLRESNETEHVLTIDSLKRLMGKTIEEIAELLLKDVHKQKAVEIMKQCCKTEQVYLEKYGGVLYPYLEETLKKLVDKYSLFIVSNCQEGYIETFLSYHKLEKYFCDYENHGRTNLSKGENIKLIIKRNKLDKAVYVGDTQGDYNAAKYADIPFIHAKYGFGRISEKTYSLKSFNELPSIIKMLGTDL